MSERLRGAAETRFIADRGDGGRRLDQAIHRHLGSSHGVSRTGAQRLVSDGRALVNGSPPRRAAQRLAVGDMVTVEVTRRRPAAPPRADRALALGILHEDDTLLVVIKPAGVVAHPTAIERAGTLVNALMAHAADATPPWTPHLVQRLDRGTSGLLVVAKSAAAHAMLQTALADGEKDYLTVVWGRPQPGRGDIVLPLGRDPLDRRRVVVRTTGRHAHTGYATLARSARERRGLSLLRLRLHTGRTHQIRVHVAARGWPIVGDATYGRPPRTRLASVPLDRLARAFARPALHAWRLSFRLPGASRAMTFEAPVPPDFNDLLSAAGLDRALDAHTAAPVDQRRHVPSLVLAPATRD